MLNNYYCENRICSRSRFKKISPDAPDLDAALYAHCLWEYRDQDRARCSFKGKLKIFETYGLVLCRHQKCPDVYFVLTDRFFNEFKDDFNFKKVQRTRCNKKELTSLR